MFMATFFFKKQSWVLRLFAAFLVGLNMSLHADPVDIPDPINILNQQRLLGEFKGGRPQLETNGVVMTLQSISDLLGNVQGGQKEGGTYTGLLNLGLAVDLQKVAGWEGASFKNTWLWLYGNDVSKNFIGDAFTASTIAGAPAWLFALSSICTHRNCLLTAEPDHSFFCNCHGSTFDENGKVTEGPAKRNLPVLATREDEFLNFLVTVVG